MLSLLMAKGGFDLRNEWPEFNDWGCRVWEVWELKEMAFCLWNNQSVNW